VSSLFKKVEQLLSKRRSAYPSRSLRREVKIIQNVHGRRFPAWKQFLHIKKVLSGKEYFTLVSGVVLFVISLVWFGVAAASTQLSEVPKVGGNYTEGVVGGPQLINPLFSTLNDVDADVSRLVFSGLMRYDKDRRLIPDIASGFEVSEDKKTYTFYIRENAMWHDGTPFTASDVVYTIETVQDGRVGSPLRVSFEGVAVDAPTDHQVVFTLSEPYPSFLSSLTIGILPQHVWSNVAPETMRLAQGNLKPVGTGPYKFKRLIKDSTGVISRVELERFEHFYQDAAYIQEFNFVFFHDYEGLDGAIQALRQQEVDGLHFIPFSLREKVKRKHTTLKTLQLPQYSALFINQNNNAFLKDKNVRSALARGIDKDRILHETLSNEGEVIHGPILPGFPGFEGNFNPYQYSIEEANKLLDESYERVGADTYKNELKEKRITELMEIRNASSTEGVDEEQLRAEVTAQVEQELEQEFSETQLFYRKNKDGQTLRVTVLTADTPEYKKASQIIAGAWEELGIITNVEFVAPKDIGREVLRKRSYDVLLYSVIVGNDPDQYPFWHSSQIEYPGLNLSSYANRSIDELLQKIRETDSEQEQENLYREFQSKLLEDIPAIFLYSPTYTYVLTEKVNGFDIEHISHPSDRFTNVTEWYVKTKHVWRMP